MSCGTLATNVSRPVGYKVELVWIEHVGQAHPTDTQLDWNQLMNSSCSSNHS